LPDLFAGIISSKTRIKLLTRFFFNPKTRSYLRELAKEFNVSTNSVREELNQLTKTNLLKSQKDGRNVYYTANQSHPLFPELKSMVGKVLGLDQVIDGIVNRLGDLDKAYLIDDYAEGKDTGIIDLLLVGNIDQYHLYDLSSKIVRLNEEIDQQMHPFDEDEQKEFDMLSKIKEKILIPFGGTGVQNVLNFASKNIANQICVYPVSDINTYSDNKSNILPDAFLIKKGTRLKDFVRDKIHSDLAENFMFGIDGKTKKRLGENYELKDMDVIKIVTSSKR